jgi:hypothetical protein
LLHFLYPLLLPVNRVVIDRMTGVTPTSDQISTLSLCF